jgi:hypothetical protein
MKKLLLAALIATSLAANAEEVVVDGYGDTYESALRAAKIAALEKVTGTWINSEHYLRNNRVGESITQYNGGVIKTYKVLSYRENVVTILADVEIVKDNRVVMNSTHEVSDEDRQKLLNRQQNFNNIRIAMDSMDGNSSMVFKQTGVQYVNRGDVTSVVVNGLIVWNKKWVSDFKTLLQTSGNRGETVTDTKQRVSSGIVHNLLMLNPLLAGVASIPLSKVQDEEVVDNTPMVCFESTSECYKTQVGLRRFEYGTSIKLEVRGYREDLLAINRLIAFTDTNLYENIPVGTSRNMWHNGKEKFMNPTLMVKENSVMPVNFSYDVKTAELSRITSFRYGVR